MRSFFHEFYHPGNATLVLAGDFAPDEAKDWIHRYFGVLARGSVIRDVTSQPVPPKTVKFEQTDRVQLPRLHWVWPTVASDHKDAAALDLLSSILAEGSASRLYKALILNAQLADDVDASSDTKEIAGLFLIRKTSCRKKPYGISYGSPLRTT